MSVINLFDVTKLYFLQMIKTIFHQCCLKRVENDRLQTYHESNDSKAQILKYTYTFDVFPCFFFSQSELGHSNAKVCDGTNTCNFC